MILRWLWQLWQDYRQPYCPYCFPLVKLDTGPAIGLYHCAACESNFEERGEGELGVKLPNFGDEPMSTRPICIPLEQGKLVCEGEGSERILCRTCQHHQAILIQLLSVFEPSISNEKARRRRGDGRGKDGEEGEEEERQQFARYRADLERRYPLCNACRSRVQERLRIIEYKLRSRRLAGKPRPGDRYQSMPPPLPNRRWVRGFVAILDVFGVQGVLSAIYLAERVAPSMAHLIYAEIWSRTVIPQAIILFIIICSIALQLSITWSLLLGSLRVVMVHLISTGRFKSPLSPNPYLLLSLACYCLLWQIHQRHHQASQRINTKGQGRSSMGNEMDIVGGAKMTPMNVHKPDAIPLMAVSPSTGKGDSFDVTDRMATWNTALDNLKPTTPLTARFGDLASDASRVSPFSVPSAVRNPFGKSTASPRTPSLFSSPSTIRPTRLDPNPGSGLESFLEGLSFEERRHAASPSCASISMDQIVLTAALVLARIAIDSQLPLVAVLLVVALGLRGFLWGTLSLPFKLVLNAFALLRLAWLLFLFNHHLLPDWAFLHSRLSQVEYLVDMLVILSR